MIFDSLDFAVLRDLFHPVHNYAGYKPDVLEAPNGDGKIDATKRYLHVALKYNPPAWAIKYLARAHFEACRIAEAIGVPDAFYPRVENGTLRVLEYPAGAGSEVHTDFDLFTVPCFRSTPEDFIHLGHVDTRVRALAPQLHMGELGEAVGIGPADRHMVQAQPYPQKAIVYFAMPAHDARLPDGTTVREWLTERLQRSRVYK